MTTSAVIPVWNGINFLQANLPAVVALGAGEIIIVDDASDDGSADFIRTNYPQIKLIRHSVNQRFPRAVNAGVKSARGDLIILLNQDVKPEPDLLKVVLPHFQKTDLFAVTFNEQAHSWAKATFKAGFLEYTNGIIDDKIHYSLWASGAGSVFKKMLWDKLGGLDEGFYPGYYEDLDLGWRAWRRGLEIIWDPKAIVGHNSESAYKRAFSPKILLYIKERNFLLAQWKNLDSDQLRIHFPSLIKRIISRPGFIVPALIALPHLLQVISFRKNESAFMKLANPGFFDRFK